MTKLLVSVRSAAEAIVASRAGADLIDIKEPARGALGAADSTVWQEVRDAVGKHRPVSVALGELLELNPISRRSLIGVNYVKIGLAGCGSVANWQTRWRDAIVSVGNGITSVAVAYADWRQADSVSPTTVLKTTIPAGCGAVLMDTFDKSSGCLLDHISLDSLSRWVAASRRRGLTVAIAGSLNEQSIPLIMTTQPDYIGVRGAVCQTGRQSKIDGRLVRRMVRATRSAERTELETVTAS